MLGRYSFQLPATNSSPCPVRAALPRIPRPSAAGEKAGRELSQAGGPAGAGRAVTGTRPGRAGISASVVSVSLRIAPYAGRGEHRADHAQYAGDQGRRMHTADESLTAAFHDRGLQPSRHVAGDR